jgi:7-carboxy-7-deazaguanine synthase
MEQRIPTGNLSEIFASRQGEGTYCGDQHLFVRFAGCNIRCSYCDTPESLVRVATCHVDYPSGRHETHDNPLDVATLVSITERFVREDPSIKMISLTGGEPMVQAAFIAAWLDTAPPAVSLMLETAATISRGLDAILPHLRVVSADVKLPSSSGEAPFWEQHREFLARCAEVQGLDLYVKMPIDDATSEEDVRRGARMVGEVAPGARLFMQPVTDPDDGSWQLGSARMGALLAAAAAECPDTALRPQVHKLLGVR